MSGEKDKEVKTFPNGELLEYYIKDSSVPTWRNSFLIVQKRTPNLARVLESEHEVLSFIADQLLKIDSKSGHNPYSIINLPYVLAQSTGLPETVEVLEGEKRWESVLGQLRENKSEFLSQLELPNSFSQPGRYNRLHERAFTYLSIVERKKVSKTQNLTRDILVLGGGCGLVAHEYLERLKSWQDYWKEKGITANGVVVSLDKVSPELAFRASGGTVKITPSQIEKEGVKFIQGDLLDLPSQARRNWEVVDLSHVLEFVNQNDWPKALKEIDPLLCKGGILKFCLGTTATPSFGGRALYRRTEEGYLPLCYDLFGSPGYPDLKEENQRVNNCVTQIIQAVQLVGFSGKLREEPQAEQALVFLKSKIGEGNAARVLREYLHNLAFLTPTGHLRPLPESVRNFLPSLPESIPTVKEIKREMKFHFSGGFLEENIKMIEPAH